jgi:hypothetical protein
MAADSCGICIGGAAGVTLKEAAASGERKKRVSPSSSFGGVLGISVLLLAVGLEEGGGGVLVLVFPRLVFPPSTPSKSKSQNPRSSNNKSIFGVSCTIPSFTKATKAVTSPLSCLAHASFKTGLSSACSWREIMSLSM